MMKRASVFSVLVVFLIPMIIGLALCRSLSIESTSKMKGANLTVPFYWPGVQPRVVEQEATSKLEAVFATVQGVRNIHSRSGN